MFISHGYAVAIIDHFSPRGIAIDFNFVNVSEAMMLSDFTSTAKYLMSNYKSRLQKNIGYIGWSKGGIASLSLKHNIIYEKYMPKDIELSFVAGMYTYCGVGYEKYNYSNIPVLIISGRSDEVTPSKYCEDLYNKNKNKEIIEYHEIKNAYHGFDNHAFLLGAYLPWQPILIDSEKCRIMVNEFLETTNVLKNSTLTTPSSRQDFINACTQRGAYVKYNYESSKISKILVMDFIKKYMSVNN